MPSHGWLMGLLKFTSRVRFWAKSVTGPVNLGNPHELSVLQFAREIVRATGSRSKIVFKPLPEDDPKQRRPDITRAQKLLKWLPKVALAEGLEKTVAYFRKKVLG